MALPWRQALPGQEPVSAVSGAGCDGSARAGVRQSGGNCRQCGAEQAGKHSRSGNTPTW